MFVFSLMGLLGDVKTWVRAKWETAEGISIPMISGLPVFNRIAVLIEKECPTCQPVCCKNWGGLVWSKQGQKWFVIGHQNEISAIQELVKLLECKYYGQSIDIIRKGLETEVFNTNQQVPSMQEK